ncbi:hypothetical protein J4209_00170 [Candidatus Woesearchaeota archaeon]|nr:hypothetical protein [Candidatus Woesearchaeota archaeon]
MLCIKCKKKEPCIRLKHLGPLCNNCFCTIIEKRIRKHIRINKIFKKNDNILVIGDLCHYLVKKIIKDLPVKIIKTKKIKRTKGYKVVIPWTLDDETNCFLNEILSKGKTKARESAYIRLLENITDEEALLFSKLKGISFKPKKKNKDIKSILDQLEERYPETKFSLLKSINQIKRL